MTDIWGKPDKLAAALQLVEQLARMTPPNSENAGEELTAFAQVIDKAKEAVAEPDAEPDEEEEEIEKQEYALKICVTGRLLTETTFEAENDEAAAAYVRALDPSDFSYEYESGSGFDGDEIAYYRLSDDWESDDKEIELRKDGEPLSWVACEIVKELATINAKDHTDAVHDQLWKLVGQAAEACSNAPTGMQEG